MTVEGESIVWRISDWVNGGGEGFLNAHYAREKRVVKAGEVLRGRAEVRLIAPQKKE